MPFLALPRSQNAVLSAMLLLAFAVVVPDEAQAAPTPTSAASVTWSVEPADADAATGKAWTELTLDAGQSVTEYMLITNRGLSDVTFDLSAADGYFTDTGRFNMLANGEKSMDAGTWIAIPDEVEVGAGQSVIIPFEVSVPANATPGDHPAGVAAGIRTGDGVVGVESRVGFRVMTRVRGELAPALTVTEQSATYTPSWNPFLPGSLAVTATVVNSGNTRLAAQPTVHASGLLGVLGTHGALAELPELAPGESRMITAMLADVWPTFVTDVRTDVVPRSIDGSGPVATASADTRITTMPFSQLVVGLCLVLAATLLLWGRRRRRRALQRMLDDAREEGRRTAVMGRVGLVVACVAAAAGTCVVGSVSVSSASELTAGVTIEVEVTPAPARTTSSTTTSPGSPPGDTAPGSDLASTGFVADPWLAVTAGGLILGERSRPGR
ncbi:MULTISPECIES: COG1470 family protein [unclassified Microbacterium]|uniref:COG1470 family protein n=1 Tax=unclassified Microbacterium TaxID=2609290 RepID=UPI001786389F|nr:MULTISPECIES: hypothetical protein [unclassified Microbacterium]MBD8205842.1 hypothetical protein [Microbacterium sp. CFBP 8801]MBD8476723.1 hypothetical protein [Microbacterium sp. CFBP 8794]MBD8509416.1 hypothetical protein [Microbacterium sp. CFBP 8790]